MKKKIGAAFLAVSLALTGTVTVSVSEVQAAPSAKMQAAYSAQASFAKQSGLDAKSISSPMFYDVNNDKSEEIILSASSKDGYGPWISYIGIYSKNGTKLLAKNVESEYFYEIRRIKNKTHKNMLAFVHDGGSGGASVSVNVFKNNTLKEIYLTDVLNTDTAKITDDDKDGNDEIQGYQLYSSIETRSLSKAEGVYDKLVYKWDAGKKKYTEVVYGQDGVRDSQRAKVGTINAQQAMKILRQAYYKQINVAAEGLPGSLRKNLQSVFTYNFLYKIETEGMISFGNGKVGPMYLNSDDFSLLLPAFDASKKATFKLSASKQSATVTQKLIVNSEGYEYKVTYQATLFKTKYGWKVDSFKTLDYE
ncbi:MULTISPECIES: hypothetical protein [Saccharibacillus]|uniref:hypothetical protein n=1 Tax=Saccharibacillus TaxID=456492 RepID=UPI0012396810|nr:hypothetical protein [Saccharibacillus sp. WB 17]MWJ33205.1 hypothetical protein [Saccharibacillus sp. WB 17]